MQGRRAANNGVARSQPRMAIGTRSGDGWVPVAPGDAGATTGAPSGETHASLPECHPSVRHVARHPARLQQVVVQPRRPGQFMMNAPALHGMVSMVASRER
jgi:hypothetical protein